MSLFPEIELSKLLKEEAKPEAVVTVTPPVTEAKEFPPSPPKEVYAKTPSGEPLLTSEDIEKLKERGKQFASLIQRARGFLGSREERHAEREIAELEKEIEKLKGTETRVIRLQALESEKEKLRKELEALKAQKLKETI
jgi:hypothetical protein